MDLKGLPLHTNKAVALRKEKRKTISKRSERAIESGNHQDVIDTLTEKQRRFCEAYVITANGTQSVLQAGYQTKYPNRIAFQLLENPAIRLCIDSLRIEREGFADVTKDFVLRKIVKTLEKAEADNNHNATLRAAELLAKHLGMFVERTEISGPDGEAIEIQRKTEEEAASFLRLIDRTAKR